MSDEYFLSFLETRMLKKLINIDATYALLLSDFLAWKLANLVFHDCFELFKRLRQLRLVRKSVKSSRSNDFKYFADLCHAPKWKFGQSKIDYEIFNFT